MKTLELRHVHALAAAQRQQGKAGLRRLRMSTGQTVQIIDVSEHALILTHPSRFA
jgi:hypothetical protein